MARPSKLWYRKDRKAWFVTIDGKRHNLGPDKKKAEKEFHKLMAADAPPPDDILAVDMLDRFLIWTNQSALRNENLRTV